MPTGTFLRPSNVGPRVSKRPARDWRGQSHYSDGTSKATGLGTLPKPRGRSSAWAPGPGPTKPELYRTSMVPRQERRLAEPLADLTAQELKVALKVAEGNTNREAAAELFISAKTVEHHLSAVYAKLGDTLAKRTGPYCGHEHA